jgi:hypothetical protein
MKASPDQTAATKQSGKEREGQHEHRKQKNNATVSLAMSRLDDH